MDDFSSMLLRGIMQFFTSIASSFARLFGRKPNPLPPAEVITVMARNPPVNRRLLSPVPCGGFFGARGNQYVVKPENMDGHVLVVGTPGSGKSSCVAIPTLRNWKGSVFAIDIKGELYENTKQHRRNIKLFDPADKDSQSPHRITRSVSSSPKNSQPCKKSLSFYILCSIISVECRNSRIITKRCLNELERQRQATYLYR